MPSGIFLPCGPLGVGLRRDQECIVIDSSLSSAEEYHCCPHFDHVQIVIMVKKNDP